MIHPLPEDLKLALKAEIDALHAVEGSKGLSPELLAFNKAIAKALVEAQSAIREEIGSQQGGARHDVALVQSSEGEQYSKRPLDLGSIELYPKILKELLSVVDDNSPKDEDGAGISLLIKASSEDSDLLVKMVRAAMPGGDARDLSEIARKTELPVDALLLVGRMLATPYIKEARIRAGIVDVIDSRNVEGREAGVCPTCSSLPALSFLEKEDGSRRLMCSLCGDSWLAPRLMCAACGNREQSKMATLCLDERDPRWVEVCDVCRRYIKTVDGTRLEDKYCPVIRAEDVRTMYLDMIAEEDKYLRISY